MATSRRSVKVMPVPPTTRFFTSGCALLDCVLGGGWATGKVINVVGDKSTGKTLLAIEACANFVRAFLSACHVTYIEAESAFDPSYAATIGFPETNLTLVDDIGTVEGLWRAVVSLIESNKDTKLPHLVVVDSLDALSDEAEMGREIGDATYGAGKAKLLSEGFRTLIRDISAANITLFVISQIRDKIGAMANAKQAQRSGGHALDFYASQVLWLYETGKIKKTVGGLERAIGVNIKARCEKNKVGWPWRECAVPIIYGYGMDDRLAAFEWIAQADPDRLTAFDSRMKKENFKRYLKDHDRTKVDAWVREAWEAIDQQFRPQESKYPAVPAV